MIKNIFKGLLIIIAVVVSSIILWFLTLGIIYSINKVTCPKFGEQIEQPTKYDFLTGYCYIQLDNGQWVDTYRYKNVSLEY